MQTYLSGRFKELVRGSPNKHLHGTRIYATTFALFRLDKCAREKKSAKKKRKLPQTYPNSEFELKISSSFNLYGCLTVAIIIFGEMNHGNAEESADASLLRVI